MPLKTDSGTTGKGMNDGRDGSSGKTEMSLSKREKEILKLVASGMTADEIAAQLFVSLDTVESHKRNIVSKMGARNTVDAVVKAMRMGVIR